MRYLLILLFVLLAVLPVTAQAQTDEGNTLRLENAVNAIRVNTYGQPARTPSSKLRRIAGTWKVIYTANAAAIESTLLYGLILDTVRDATFATTEIYYSTFDEAGQWMPEQIAAVWQVQAVNWWIYQTPLHVSQGCGYRFDTRTGHTQAFCIYGTEWDSEPTVTPAPLRLPPMPTSRPLSTSTPTPMWRRP